MSKSLDDVIRRVEHLLRHARSSKDIGYTDEADTYLEAAQSIMSRYRIEESQLFARDDKQGIVRREFPIKGPYFLDKAMLIDSVARNNFCRALQGKGYVAIYGHDSDIEFTITLFQNLLVDMIVQMERALKKRQEDNIYYDTVAWKRSFFSGYAIQIGQRLARIRDSSSGEYALVAVDREHEISEFWQELTEHLHKSSRPLSSLEGYEAGKVSGSTVDLGQTKISNADSKS